MQGKRVMILGMARSGVAAAKLLSEKGAFVRINDLKTREQLGKALEPLEGLANIEWRLGEKPDELLPGMDMLVISPGVPIESEIVKRAESLGVEVVGEIELSARLSKGRKPRPVQLGQAPIGLLKENILGSNSGREMPQSSQA